MREEPVMVRAYHTGVEALIARALLNAHGIDPVERRQDSRGLLRAVQGAQLVVRREDFEVAREVLDASAGPSA